MKPQTEKLLDEVLRRIKEIRIQLPVPEAEEFTEAIKEAL